MSKEKTVRAGAFQFKGSGNINKNCRTILRGIKLAAKKKVDLLVTQECALTGYAGVDIESPAVIDRRLLKESLKEISQQAAAHDINIAVGTTDFEDDTPYNSMRLYGKNGRLKKRYNKRAMYGTDNANYTPGNASAMAKINKTPTGLLVCYDFRFPEYFRELLFKKVELVLLGMSMVGANDKKRPVARAHLMSRAAENGMWIVAANSLSLTQNAPTCIVNPQGEVVAEASAGREELIFADVDTDDKTELTLDIIKHAKTLAKG